MNNNNVDQMMSAAIASGNIMIGDREELVSISASTREAQEKHAANLKSLETKSRQQTMIVPTRDEEVKLLLRSLGFPICLFGERALDRRERLKALLASREIDSEISGESFVIPSSLSIQQPKQREERQTKVFYTEASDSLIVARQRISESSWERARKRLLIEYCTPIRMEMENNKKPVLNLEVIATQNEPRPISSCSFSSDSSLVVTGSFDERCRIYRTSNDYGLVQTLTGHVHRICDVSFRPSMENSNNMLASGSAEGEVRIWKATEDISSSFECVVLSGHVQRIGRLAWHPTGNYLASTSYDRTWRLWDVETSTCLLTQDGHAREVYSTDIHPDGALICTTDLGAACRVWDLRSGKTTHTFQGHILGILASNFSSNGCHLATGGSDNQVRIWDLRKKECLQILPAHLRTVTSCKFSSNQTGSWLYTSSHDRSINVWNTKTWTKAGVLINAHESPIFGIDVDDKNRLVSCGYDRALKFIEIKL